ncbi:MAG: hydantoinase/oxoprolinase family protein [Desulfamplus sp.]|nr:hydantoinase/oxoprolinase family protein [Desulfamplus sp.]MBF0257584.1 hydantoinase/oxoprolinase family protein [Desulfamplus sp.]
MIIGLDVGGTHTDAVLLSENGLERDIKVPTDTSNLFNTVLSGFDLLLDGIDSAKIKRIVISTTLTTNSVVQKQLNPVGIIVSSGPGIDPELFRRGEHFYAVSGSIDHRGRERQPINRNEIEQISEKMQHAGIEYVGVIGKFSPRNPAHEIEICEILKKNFPTVFLGHRVSGNLNFPRRISTVHLNTAVYSMHKNFFNAVNDTLKQKGLTAPIQILKADGGTMNLRTSMEFPGQTILSGPAASVMGSIHHAPADKDVLVLDIGGTTTDIAIIVNRAPLLEPVGIGRGKYKSLIRALQTTSRGIGGDSQVTVIEKYIEKTDVEQNGSETISRKKIKALKIGPDRQGPALAFGGPALTPTDAMIWLGIMDGGDKKLSEEGLTLLSEALELSIDQTAEKIFYQTCTTIVNLANQMVEQINSKPVYTVHEFLEGYQIKPQLILLLGGPASHFSDAIQKISGIPTMAVPHSSVANAIGAALARTTCEVSLLVDTERGVATAPEENFTATVSTSYRKDDAINTALALLEKKAVNSGADLKNFEAEVTEFQSFNIVRQFAPRGKIFRIKMQVKPGLIKGFSHGF